MNKPIVLLLFTACLLHIVNGKACPNRIHECLNRENNSVEEICVLYKSFGESDCQPSITPQEMIEVCKAKLKEVGGNSKLVTATKRTAVVCQNPN